MQIEKDIREQKRLVLTKQVEGVLLHRMQGLGREAVILEGEDPVAVAAAFNGFLKALKKSLLLDEEPMMNLVGLHEEGKWRLVIFPRRKHRPDAFFKEGNDRVVVSPGVIDMAGVLVTPVERDFERLDAAAVEGIYREVSLDGKTVERPSGKCAGGTWRVESSQNHFPLSISCFPVISFDFPRSTLDFPVWPP